MRPKIILDLCGGSGSWSLPYREAGYDVRNITLPEFDVNFFTPPDNVYGVIAAPPCTHFSKAGNRLWSIKDKDGRTIDALHILVSCLKIIALCSPHFWVLENPPGRMKHFMGSPAAKYYHYEFGIPCTKLNLLWGKFSMPSPISSRLDFEEIYRLEEIDYKMPELYSLPGIIVTDHSRRAAVRSLTPPGFASAFFMCNR